MTRGCQEQRILIARTYVQCADKGIPIYDRIM